ncbi:MAG TPA: hypothetical protein VK738_09460 [Terriglobales bacterium]|jgi:hypothetical protein|nr:hypothetical protein [Terriglobales bacterium]
MSKRAVKPNPEYDAFSKALGKVLEVSHSDMQAMLEAEKAGKKRNPKRGASSRAKGASARGD